jgi:hypothetical protein
MAVDRYTKTLLTVIAGCLVWLCAVGPPGPAHAQQPVPLQNTTGAAVPVVIVGTGSITRAGQLSVVFHGDHSDPTVPVALPYTPEHRLPTELPYTPSQPLPAEVVGVRHGTQWDPLRVAVEDAALRAKPGIGRE